MATAAARTEILEAQLQALENEQAEMKKVIKRTKEDERAAVARWKQAERIIADLTAEVERIEREHRMEKARAQNLMERLEKRQIGDRNPGTLPTALAERTAMSQFMRDILAENNHLQSALAELRDMLLTSQEEVGALREQLLQSGGLGGTCTPTPLSRELPIDAGRLPLGVTPAPELHFHHHVHKEKVVPRRVKRRSKAPMALDPNRRSMTTPSDVPSSPTTPGSARLHRWSQLSSHTRSSSGRGLLSFPSSPQSVSTFRDSSIFDRDYGVDSTRPSTADTEWDSGSVQKFSDRMRRRPRDSTGGPPFSILYTEEIPENLAEDESDDNIDEDEEDEEMDSNGKVKGDAQFDLNGTPNITCPASPGARSMLRKSASHESLLVPASSMYLSSTMASFKPTSPAAIAAAAASKEQAMSAHTHNRDGASSAAYNHLHLLAGGNIRGKGLVRSNTSGSSRGRWFGGWGWGATPFGASFKLTAPSEESETDASSVTTPTSGARSPAVSIAGFRSKGTPAEALLASEGVSAGTSPARSVQSTKSGRSNGGMTSVPAPSRPVPISVYRSMVDEQLLRETMMESMQM